MSKNLGSVAAGDGFDHLAGAPLRRTAGGIPRYQPLPAAQGLMLTQAQAEAAYTAMCALNNVSSRLMATFEEKLRVVERPSGGIYVLEMLQGEWSPSERYDDQAAFATAYSLQQGLLDQEGAMKGGKTHVRAGCFTSPDQGA